MKNSVANQSNKRFLKVQEEMKRLLSIVMYTVEEQVDGFDSIIANSNNPEVIRVAEELNKSSKKLDKNAKEFVESIGIPSRPEPQKTPSKKVANRKNISTSSIINPIVNNINSKGLNKTLINGRDEEQR